MKKILIIFLLISFITSSDISGKNLKKVGVILYSKAFSEAFEGFKDGLAKLGYVENKNIIYYVKNINTNLKKIDNILKEFKQKDVNIILTTTTYVALTVKKYIDKYKIPVIFNVVGAPLKSHVVNSLSKPGGWITGVSHIAFQLVPKRLELFKEAFPYLENIIFFYKKKKGYYKNQLQLIIPTAKKLHLKILPVTVCCRADMKKKIKDLSIPKNTGIFMWPDVVATANLDLIIKLSKAEKLPLMVIDNILLLKGGCIGYSPSFYKVGRQSSFIAQKIFSGIYPGNIPVQLPEFIELVINLKEINNLNLMENFNKNFLLYADKVIK